MSTQAETTNPDIEVRLRWLSPALVAAFAAALTAGVLLHLVSPYSHLSVRLLQTGLVLLMAAPGVRILVAVAERVRRRDWSFVLMTVIVVAELALVLWRAGRQG